MLRSQKPHAKPHANLTQKQQKTSRKTSRKPHAETTKDPRFNVSP